jgi:hypothetical protein
MKFPGGKLLHTWDVAQQRVSAADLLRSCQDVGLTGFAELKLEAGAGVIFFYAGTVVSAVYREGALGYHGQDALDALGSMGSGDGLIEVYELPVEMAHLLRGITNRHRLPQSLYNPAELQALLEDLKRQMHTGMLEVQAASGAAAILMINGRISNLYWDAGDGRTFEQSAALVALQQALTGAEAPVFQSTFSRESWRTRRSAHDLPLCPSQHKPADGTLVEQEMTLRRRALEDLDAHVPALLQAMVFDLLTGVVLDRRIRGTAALPCALIAERIPALVVQFRQLVASERDDDVESIELSSERLTVLVAALTGSQEAIVVIAERSQPAAHVAVILGRVVRAYETDRRRGEQSHARPAPPLRIGVSSLERTPS